MLSRRAWFVLFVILAILKLPSFALAQEVVIFGYRVSFLLMAPIILLAIFLIIFILVFLRETLKEKYGSIREAVLKIKEIKPEKKIKPEEVSILEGMLEEEKKPAMDYISEINQLRREMKFLSAQEAYQRLINIIRTFFSELLQIDYKFTFDELEKELKKKYKNVVFFSKNLSGLCYTSEEISKPKLLNVLNEFDGVIRNILVGEETLSEKPFLGAELGQDKQEIERIKRERELKKELERKEKERKKYEKELLRRNKRLEEEINVQKRIDELKKKEEELERKTVAVLKQDKTGIINLINKGEEIIGKDIKKAAEIYKEVYDVYLSLPEEDKKVLYTKLMKLYNKISKAMPKS